MRKLILSIIGVSLLALSIGCYDDSATRTSDSDAISIEWQGSLETAPVPADINYAYFNRIDQVSYIYNGISWDTLSVSGDDGIDGLNGIDGIDGDDGQNGVDGIKGVDGLDVIWRGADTIPPFNAQTNWAYYNINDRRSYIYDGHIWSVFTQDGSQGEDGVSIVWKGELSSPPTLPSDPQLAINWAYFNTVDEISYIYDGDSWDILADAQGTKVAPTVRMITGNTTIVEGTTITLKAVAIDPADKSRSIASSNGFIWAVDGENFNDTTDIGELEVTLATNGIYNIWVMAVDNDGLLSAPDVVEITVE
jgi:hypothetical protein